MISDTRRVAVVMGGPSGEHAVSLKSGYGVVAALTHRHWTVEPVVISQHLTLADATACARRALTQCSPDAVFIALHGPFGEDGTIQQVCEELSLPYTGSEPAASRLGIDKVAARQRFEQAGLLVPRWETMDVQQQRQRAIAGIAGVAQPRRCAYPLVVKPIGQGSSLGVSLVHRAEELPAALAAAAPFGPLALVEEFIAGREVTVGILGDEPLPVIEIRPKPAFFTYAAKYTAGQTDYLAPAPLAPSTATAIQAAARAAHQALGCRHFSRADLILGSGDVPVLLEVNTIPGLTPTSLLPKAAACLGIAYDELCEGLLTMALEGSAVMGSDPLFETLRRGGQTPYEEGARPHT